MEGTRSDFLKFPKVARYTYVAGRSPEGFATSRVSSFRTFAATLAYKRFSDSRNRFYEANAAYRLFFPFALRKRPSHFRTRIVPIPLTWLSLGLILRNLHHPLSVSRPRDWEADQKLWPQFFAIKNN